MSIAIDPVSYFYFKYMDGGQIDGQEVMVTMVKPTRGGGPRRHKFDHDSRR